ncbi:MAG: hypothetical protein PF637_10190 [Spirochaetes bacterium]|jgi:Tfp pilus assembly major pilin PilA|nr:hypothetical protein [Spirochaetota bacterium]
MKLKQKALIFFILLALLTVITTFLYFKYYFTYEQKNVVKRKIESITGMNLTVTVFDMNGKIVKRWSGVQKVTSGDGSDRDYSFFYTKDGKYVQIPNSVWYIAEETSD